MKKKNVLLLVLLIFIICLLAIRYLPLGSNYTKSTLHSIEIPRLSIFTDECCMSTASFKSFRSTNSLKKEINKILSKYEKITCDGTTYYYNQKSDITIYDYGVEKSFPLNKFYISYDKGKIIPYECEILNNI